MSTIRLEIVTAERAIYSEDVNILVAPGIDGELAILPHHAPLLTVIQPGELRIVDNNKESFVAISGGFLEVMGNHIIILADTAEHSEEIDLKRAEEALERAQERVQSSQMDIDLERGVAALKRSQARVKVAYRRRRERPRAQQPVK